MSEMSAVSSDLLAEVAPFHLVIDKDVRIESWGKSLSQCIPGIVVGTELSSLVSVVGSDRTLSYEDLADCTHSVLILEVRSTAVKLKGRIIKLSGSESLLFQGAPWVSDFKDLYSLDLMLTNLEPWEPFSDFLKLFDRQHSALAEANELASRLKQHENLLLEKNKSLEERNALLLQAREMIQRQQQEFNKFSLIAAQTDNAVMITDTTGVVEWVNVGFVRLFGYSFEEALGKDPFELLTGPATNPRTVQDIRQMLLSEQGFSYELLNYDKAGEELWVLVQCQPILDSNRDVTGFLAIQSDITEQRQRAEEVRLQRDKLATILRSIGDAVLTVDQNGIIDVINDAALELLGIVGGNICGKNVDSELKIFQQDGTRFSFIEFQSSGGRSFSVVDWCRLELHDGGERKVVFSVDLIDMPFGIELLVVIRDLTEALEVERIKSDFVATVSHELRTPLTSLKGVLALLRRRSNMKAETQDECLELAEQQTDRLVSLVNDILEFSRLESTQAAYNFEFQDFAAIVHRCCLSVSGLCEQYQVAIVEDVPDSLPEVYCDKSRMESVFTNLLSNAVKFSPREESVEISVKQKESLVVVEVSDRGVGIPEDEQTKIFQRFHRVEGVSQLVPGTGLGLSIVKKIIDLHGADISVKSAPGEGSTFQVVLPIGPAAV